MSSPRKFVVTVVRSQARRLYDDHAHKGRGLSVFAFDATDDNPTLTHVHYLDDKTVRQSGAHELVSAVQSYDPTRQVVVWALIRDPSSDAPDAHPLFSRVFVLDAFAEVPRPSVSPSRQRPASRSVPRSLGHSGRTSERASSVVSNPSRRPYSNPSTNHPTGRCEPDEVIERVCRFRGTAAQFEPSRQRTAARVVHGALPLPPGLRAAAAAGGARSISAARAMHSRPRSLSRDFEPPEWAAHGSGRAHSRGSAADYGGSVGGSVRAASVGTQRAPHSGGSWGASPSVRPIGRHEASPLPSHLPRGASVSAYEAALADYGAPNSRTAPLSPRGGAGGDRTARALGAASALAAGRTDVLDDGYAYHGHGYGPGPAAPPAPPPVSVPLSEVPARAAAFAASCEALAALAGGLVAPFEAGAAGRASHADVTTAAAVMRDILAAHAPAVEAAVAAVGAAAAALSGITPADGVLAQEAPEARGRLDAWLTDLAAVCSRHGAAVRGDDY